MPDLVQNITVWQNPKVTAMPEAHKEPTLRDMYILLQVVDQRLTAIENDLNRDSWKQLGICMCKNKFNGIWSLRSEKAAIWVT